MNYLANNPNATVELVGTGSSQRLAEDRAYALQGLLYDNGIEASRMKVSSSSRNGNSPVQVKIQ